MNQAKIRFALLAAPFFVMACGGGAAEAPATTTPAAAEAAPAQTWQAFAPPGEGFSVEFPGPPVTSQQDLGEGVTQNQYVYESPDQTAAYIVAVVHRATPATAEETPALLQRAYRAMSQMEGAQAQAPQAITANGESGIGFVMQGVSEGQTVVFVTKMFVHGNKFIQFMAVVDPAQQEAAQEGVQHFLNSVALQ